MQLTNFGGNVRFEPADFFVPESQEEVLLLLAEHRGRNIRVVGRLHSWSNAPRGDDVVMDLRRLDSVSVEQREDGVWAVLGAGCQVKRAVAELDRQLGVTLPSLGLIDEQSIAGAIATGTHGSGRHSLSHYVGEVTLATYDPQTGESVVRTLSGGQELMAARCCLGCLGVVLSVGIRCRDKYRVEEHLRLYDHPRQALEAEEQYPLQQFYYLPLVWNCLAQLRRETDQPRSWLAPFYHWHWFLMVDIGLHMMVLILSRRLRSKRLLRAFMRYIVPTGVPRGWRVVDESHRILTMQHELFRHIEIELFVRRTALLESLEFVKQVLSYAAGEESAIDAATWARLEESGLAEPVRGLLRAHVHHYPICVRKVLPDQTLISMSTGGDEPWYAVSFISYLRPRHRQGFFALAGVLTKTMARFYGARPHWGKVCPLDAELAEALYERLPEFRRLCEQADPPGLFRNAWIKQTLFGE